MLITLATTINSISPFYSLLGVSKSYPQHSENGTSHRILSFYSLLGVSAPCTVLSTETMFLLFLLPFGSFQLYLPHKFLTPFWEYSSVYSIATFYSLLGVSSHGISCDYIFFLLPFGSFCNLASLSTPFWEFLPP